MATRIRYTYELAEVQRALLHLSDVVQQAIQRAVAALAHSDQAAARQIIRNDDDVDERRADIEERVLRLINNQQPVVAADLRFLLAAVRVADELERIGDYAEGIADLVLRDAAVPPAAAPPEIDQLADHVRAMLAQSVQAFVDRDAAAVARLEHADDRADELTRTVRAAMTGRIQHEPNEAARALHLLFAAHNLERIADRAVNIAERAAFMARKDEG